jgi:hypothetical protein
MIDAVDGSGGSRLLRQLACAFVAAYAVFLFAEPLGHHDLPCHIKSPLHCASCVVSPLSTGSRQASAADIGHLANAGNVIADGFLPLSVLPSVRASGRAPPVRI